MFSHYTCLLLQHMEECGFHACWDSVKRRAGEAGTAGDLSKHVSGLAVDINLYDKGYNYLPSGAEHVQFGAYWKSLHPECTWGGDFPGDGNHYSWGEH
jgi:D-alanyl-D-alanine dipeptidase